MAAKAKISIVAALAEFIAMTLFIVFGCGAAMGIKGSNENSSGDGGSTSVIPGWVLMVALAFGFSITLLAYSIGHYSGGQINCAVTFGLVLAGELPIPQAIANFVAQMLGSCAGALILCCIFPLENDWTGALGSNSIGENWSYMNAIIAEAFGTFLLVFVVLQTAVNSKSAGNRAQACIAIGLAVFAAHCVLIPIDGCSINPTRSFGPAVIAHTRAYSTDKVEVVHQQHQIVRLLQDTGAVGDAANAGAAAAGNAADSAAGVLGDALGGAEGAVKAATGQTQEEKEEDSVTRAPHTIVMPNTLEDMWVFWLGPLLGAAAAAGVYRGMLMMDMRESAGDYSATESAENE